MFLISNWRGHQSHTETDGDGFILPVLWIAIGRHYLCARGRGNKIILYTQRGLVKTWASKDYASKSIYYQISCFTFLLETILNFAFF